MTVIPGEFTASCFINTDQDANQIVAFYAGALSHGHRLELGGRGLGPEDLMVISPTDPESMLKAVEACRTARVPYLFDPGKQTPRLEARQILDGMESAAAVVGNDYEFALMSQKTGKSEAVLQCIAPVTIVTRGEQGSTVLERGRPPVDVPVAPIKALVIALARATRTWEGWCSGWPGSCRGRWRGGFRRGGGGVRDRGPRVPGAPVRRIRSSSRGIGPRSGTGGLGGRGAGVREGRVSGEASGSAGWGCPGPRPRPWAVRTDRHRPTPDGTTGISAFRSSSVKTIPAPRKKSRPASTRLSSWL